MDQQPTETMLKKLSWLHIDHVKQSDIKEINQGYLTIVGLWTKVNQNYWMINGKINTRKHCKF